MSDLLPNDAIYGYRLDAGLGHRFIVVEPGLRQYLFRAQAAIIIGPRHHNFWAY